MEWYKNYLKRHEIFMMVTNGTWYVQTQTPATKSSVVFESENPVECAQWAFANYDIEVLPIMATNGQLYEAYINSQGSEKPLDFY